MATKKKLIDRVIDTACKTEAGFFALLCLWGCFVAAASTVVVCGLGWLITH